MTVWKAQFREVDREGSIYCRLTYNSTERNTKPTTIDKNLTWKETFIFPLAKQESPLKLEFIGLREGEAIHFAKEQVVESLSFGRAVMNVDVDSPHRGTLPSKLDIMGRKGEPVGKIFIEYEMMKTEVAYTVEKQLDYFYLLKLTAFKVSFIRKLKTNLKFYLHFSIEGKTHK